MYEEEKWPDDSTRTAMIPLPNKNNAVNSSDYRKINLICHASKIDKENRSESKTFVGAKYLFVCSKGCETMDTAEVMWTP